MRYEVIGRNIVEPYALVAGMAIAYGVGLVEYGLEIGFWCGTLAALGFALVGVGRSFGPIGLATYRPDSRLLRTSFHAALPTTASNGLTSLLGRIDLYLVGILLGETQAGVYAMARHLAASLRQVRQSFDGLLIPLVARTLSATTAGQTGKAIASATRLVLVLQLPLLLILFAVGEPLLAFFGLAFVAGYWALLALAAAETVQAAFSIGDLVFVYLRPRIGLWLTLINIALALALALLLIPPLGIAGAALSVLVAGVARAVMRGWLLRSRFDFTVPPGHNMGPIVAALVGIGTSHVVSGNGNVLLTLCAGLSAYLAALLIWLRMGKHTLALSGFSTVERRRR